MEPRIELLSAKKLIGKRKSMSFANNTTFELWRSFMIVRKEIENTIGTDLYSVQVYPKNYFENFSPNTEFEKWATVEVSDFETIPDEMDTFELSGGYYAVFTYKGLSTDNGIFEYIFIKWLPNSEYVLDNRPHFEILGEKYKNADPNSEEEIWIPIKAKE
ncbi:GyrI-like domain-containing protein [Flavobacterium enshiense]|nr:GyrI-like domain-containing protein [Flavobacterium enshiense]UOK43969.1 GyrI-like domain-containing protein [Flavobacterium enshiense]